LQRVLLVTDSVSERAKLLDYFQEWQLDVDSLGSGPNLLEKMRQTSLGQQPYDLAVIDLQQQKLAGVQLVQQINRIAGFASLRLVLLCADRDSMNACAALRLDAVLLKPVRKQMLHDAVVTVLGRDRHEAQPLVTDRSLQEIARHSKRALLVDDNEVNQIIAKGALKKLGIHADVTNNGEEAIEAVMEKQYDFILMDCEMPIMDGFEATRCIRQWEQENGGHTPIVALTASDSGDCHDACMDAGMDEYMQKPFRADQLESILQKIEMKRGAVV
jgi:CheY-like chemotaxis protein